MDKTKYDVVDETFKISVLMKIVYVILSLITLFIVTMLYVIVWKSNLCTLNLNDLWIIPEIVLVPLLHEFIHAITYIKLSKLPKESVKFETHLPMDISVHYTEIVPINIRRWSSIMPTITICPLLLVVGLLTNSYLQTIVSAAMFTGGLSDMYSFIKLMKYKSDCMVEDKVRLTGCFVYKPKN